MENKKYTGKVQSFWSLLQQHNIEIPIIQRDYAQGREDQKELRSRFLTALYNNLEAEKRIRLDFVYGSRENDAFLPLDGQQRLTTLYLLHWYAAVKDNSISAVSQTLKKFSYETRASSRQFCASLVDNSSNLDFSLDNISEGIVDAPWFFLSWHKDPTIDAMLRVIDDIHQMFKDVDDMWGKLIRSPSIIEFYHVELEDIGLTDDLYIKMNARGKLLTPFENFKASFQKYIKDNNWENGVTISESFATRIDGVWTDLFWSHRKTDHIDEPFMRFISTIAMISMALERTTSDRIMIINRLQGNPDSVRVDYFSEGGFNYLKQCLNLYSDSKFDSFDLKPRLPFWQHEPLNGVFSSLVYENASYSQKVLFFAQTEYLLNVSSFDAEKFHEWMRVIRNLICRGDVNKSGERPAIVRSQSAFDGMIKLIKELSAGCEDIYSFLRENRVKSTFAREQILEERTKANLIFTHPDLKKSIFNAEDTNLLMGKISFLLDCSDYVPGSIEMINVVKFDKAVTVIKTYLDKEITNRIRRCLLATTSESNDYDYYNYWWSYSNAVEANKRCLIDKFREVEYYLYGEYKYSEYYRNIFKNLITILMDKDVDTFLTEFEPPDNMPNWKKRLIKEPGLLDSCNSNYIAIPEDESCCYLLPTVRPRSIEACIVVE
ncbi:MAG: DUF262 domain-containing protein [Bacteroidetes bacterium]|nr:DUF262 domain-containing protein [Bacteroidota bacterium]